MTQLLFFLILSISCAVVIERFHKPPGPWLADSFSAFILRLIAFTSLFFIDFALTWRGFHAFVFTQIIVILANLVSVGKVRAVNEPLVFSDCLLLIDVFRFPELFLMTRTKVIYIGLGTSLAMIIALGGIYLESPLQGHDNFVLRAVILSGLIALLVAPFSPPAKPLVGRWMRSLVVRPDTGNHLRKYGLIALFVIYFLRWLTTDRNKIVQTALSKQAKISAAEEKPVYDQIIIIQCESFCDLRRFGDVSVSLPNFDHLKEHALQSGLFTNAFPGGYTQRTEFAVMTGLNVEDIEFDCFYPYLKGGQYKALSLPLKLSQKGYQTTFIHPYDAGFFMRDKVLPQLGFNHLIMQDALSNLSTCGPFTADIMLGDFLMEKSAEAMKADATHNFFFVATMENHGPWYSNRIPERGNLDAVSNYCEHIQNADTMLGQLAQYFDEQDGRFLLLFYGDHVPLLTDFADPFPSQETDYLILDLGRNKMKEVSPKALNKKDINAWDVHSLIETLNRQG